MVGFFKLGTICFGLITVSSICLAFIFSWLALSKKISPEARDGLTDAMFRCAFASYYMFIATVVWGVLWCIFEVLTVAGWWPIV